MNLLNMLMGSMTSQDSVQSISGKTGLSKKQISALIALALPLLLKHMTGNASSHQGASSLLNALGQHNSKKSVPQQIEEADTEDGSKIVNHIFGDNTDAMMKQLADQSGLSTDQVASVLSHISPAMMSGISAATNDAKANAADTSKKSAAKGAGKKKKADIDLSDGLDMNDVMGLMGAVSSSGKGKDKGGTDLLSALMKAF